MHLQMTMPLESLQRSEIKVQMAEEAQKRITAAAVRTQEAAATSTDSSKAMESVTNLVALLPHHQSICVDMR